MQTCSQHYALNIQLVLLYISLEKKGILEIFCRLLHVGIENAVARSVAYSHMTAWPPQYTNWFFTPTTVVDWWLVIVFIETQPQLWKKWSGYAFKVGMHLLIFISIVV